jgi:uncharacterized SAM-binding protein YcdF (DUF218 family)
MRTWLRALLVTAAAAGIAWCGGFLWFLQTTSGFNAPALPARSDGIIALTGGAGRVELGLRLLELGRADRLLISGVGRAEFAELARRAGVPQSLAPRVTLGRAAASTRGNAMEAAEWARASNIKTALIVTSAYHMPRALAEMARTLPGVRLIAVPVLPSHEGEAARLGLLAGEYTKYLAAELGLSRFGAREEPAR